MKKFLLIFLVIFLCACQSTAKHVSNENGSVYYEIFVASFHDSNGDGTGDLNGIKEKLGYLQDLGIKGIWLMPISPSDSYHKYDVKDYLAVDSSYGTIDDFKSLVDEAKKHNIDIIIDLVLNHTSENHPWFIEAKQAKLNNTCDQTDKCDYYHFSETQQAGYTKLKDDVYYESVFWSGMPDLNLENPKVKEEIQEIVEFWLETGVKGFRLDAPYHFFEKNSVKNNEFLQWLNQVIKNKRPDAFQVGEVWADKTTILQHYHGDIDSMFDFTNSGSDGNIVATVRQQNGSHLAQLMAKYYQDVKAINPKAESSIFLSNHDQGRSAAFFSTLETRKLAASIYLLSPAIPFIYYGEEIGMLGSGRDENKRLAMVWGEGKDANSPKDADYAGNFDSSVKLQQQDKQSLWNHYRQVITLRNQYLTLDLDNVEAKDFGVKEVFALEFTTEHTRLVVHNFSDQTVNFQLENYRLLDQVDVLAKSTYKNNQVELAGYSTMILEKGE